MKTMIGARSEKTLKMKVSPLKGIVAQLIMETTIGMDYKPHTLFKVYHNDKNGNLKISSIHSHSKLSFALEKYDNLIKEEV